MNIYDFFNSHDVAEHCRSIGQTFNAVESAVMIYRSDERTREERLSAYKTIIAEYPDMEIPEACNHEHIRSFHEALERMISGERRDIHLLDSFYIDVPVPFKYGDLVAVGKNDDLDDRQYGGVYVLKDVCRNNPERHARMLLKNDLMDMTADIFYEVDGFVECECMHFYPDLHYFRGELEGEKRILKYVSLYMQDKLCLCSLLKIQKFLLLDEKTNELKENSGLRYQLEQMKNE